MTTPQEDHEALLLTHIQQSNEIARLKTRLSDMMDKAVLLAEKIAHDKQLAEIVSRWAEERGLKVDELRGEVDARDDKIELLQDVLASVYLHSGKVNFLTEQMTTEEKEAFADAVDAHFMRWDVEEGNPPVARFQRWWRTEEEHS